jgi:hypothetical protein
MKQRRNRSARKWLRKTAESLRKNRRCHRYVAAICRNKKPRKTLTLRGFSDYFGLHRNICWCPGEAPESHYFIRLSGECGGILAGSQKSRLMHAGKSGRTAHAHPHPHLCIAFSLSISRYPSRLIVRRSESGGMEVATEVSQNGPDCVKTPKEQQALRHVARRRVVARGNGGITETVIRASNNNTTSGVTPATPP